nr:hypothetical protein [Tanacetum cinerariifolium]
MKSKVTDKSDFSRRRWIPLSEMVSNKPGDIVVNAQHVSQYNPVTGQVVKETDKVQQPKVKSAVDEKDNPKVKQTVAKEKPGVVKEKPVGVTSKVSKGNDDVVKAPVVADKDDVVKAPVVADEVMVVADKAPVVKATVVYNVVADKEPLKISLSRRLLQTYVDYGRTYIAFDVVNEKASDALKNKATDVKKKSVGKGKKSTVDKPKDNVPNPKDNKSIMSSNQKVNPDVKSKVVVRVLKSKEIRVKKKRIVSKEDDRKKKLKDIDWCGYIYDCLRDSKLLSGTNHYLGPLTFLILLYLDSTKFDRFPVVRTRPAIRNWSTYLMKQRQELELKYLVLGLLDLHVEWTEAEVQDAEDVNEGDKDPNGSNPSFGFSKISLDDFYNDNGPTGIESVDPTEQETIVEVNP